jgi:hypothetical protein
MTNKHSSKKARKGADYSLDELVELMHNHQSPKKDMSEQVAAPRFNSLLSGKMSYMAVPKPSYSEMHAVSIIPQTNACAMVMRLGNRRFLANDAPQLPLEKCIKRKCGCKYQHHHDRQGEDRRSSYQKNSSLLFGDRKDLDK